MPAGRLRRKRRRLLVAALLVAAVVAAGSIALARRGRTPTVSACSVSDGPGRSYPLTPAQAQNAAIIAAVAYRKGLPDHAVTVALAAAMQESKLVNLDHGDLDSLGLFQQRPSEGWGTPAQIMDPAYAASAFYDRLVGVAGWQSMTVGTAAQTVQRSAAPDAYTPWEPQARAVATALTGEVAAGLTCSLAGWAGATPAPGALAAAATSEFGSDVLGQHLDPKAGWEVATWAVAHAFNYHLQRVAYSGRAWSPGAGGWRPDPTAGPVVTTQA